MPSGLGTAAKIGDRVLLPSAGIGCRLFVYEELLPDGRTLLRVLLWVLLLRVYLRIVWHGEAGNLGKETSQRDSKLAARNELAGGFFVFRASEGVKLHLNMRTGENDD